MRQRTPALFAFLLSLFVALPAIAQRAGQVSHLVPTGTVIHGRTASEATVGHAVEWNNIVRTNTQGRMRVALLDGSFLTLGRDTEMRVLRHDPQSQQTALEMLYGRTRVKVVKATQSGSMFTIRTPTAIAGAIGTDFLIETRERAGFTAAISAEEIASLPMPSRDIRSLLDLKPGLETAAAGEPSLLDFGAAEATTVYGFEGVTGVRNADPEIVGTEYLLPGEAALIERGKPPVKFRWDEVEESEGLRRAALLEGCPGPIDLTRVREGAPGVPKYRIVGRGTSTGAVFDLEVENPNPDCPLEVFIPHGAVLKPKGFLKRAITGLIFGSSSPPLKDFQVMMTEGVLAEVPAGFRLTSDDKAAPVKFTMRGYCMELHKLPPRPNTEYRLDAGKTGELGRYRNIVEESHRMFYTGQTRAPGVALDSVTQWALWTKLEKMKQKDFTKQYTKLVEQNYKAQKKKWDGKAKKDTAASAQTLWAQVVKVLEAAQQNQSDLEFLQRKASD